MIAKQLSWGFSPARVALLARNRMLDDLPAFGIVLGLVAGINILSLVFLKRALFNSSDGQAWFFVMSLSGAFLAAGAFKAMHRGKSGCDWLLLPATACEQYTAAFISCFVVFPAAFMLAGMGLSYILALLERVMGSAGSDIWIPFKTIKAMDFAGLLAAMAIFFAGSAKFRKLPLLKTAGIYTGFIVVLSILFSLSLLALGQKIAAGSSLFLKFASEDGLGKMGRGLSIGLRIFFLGIMPAFALVYGYFCVNEKEARDEVQ